MTCFRGITLPAFITLAVIVVGMYQGRAHAGATETGKKQGMTVIVGAHHPKDPRRTVFLRVEISGECVALPDNLSEYCGGEVDTRCLRLACQAGLDGLESEASHAYYAGNCTLLEDVCDYRDYYRSDNR